MRIMLLAGVALVVGLALGTGFVVARAPAPKPAVEKVAAAPDTGHAVMAASPAHPAATPAATVAAAIAAPTGIGSAAAAGAPPAPPLHMAPLDAVTAAQAPEDFSQVSKILVNMKPAEAVKIMACLSDAQVEGILRAVGVRQAALMLGQMPTERAAALSRRLMRPQPEHVP